MLHIEDLANPPEGFLRDEPEGAEFYQAFQTARLDDFSFGYFAVYRDSAGTVWLTQDFSD